MKIGNLFVGERIFIIAEIGNNHNGDLSLAMQMVDQAKAFGVDCVKFQMRDMHEVYRKRSLSNEGEDLGTEYVLDLLDRFQLSIEEHKKLKKYCDEQNIMYLCTPWDKNSVEILEDLEVLAYKVASADLTNLPLIHRLIQTKKPLILSTGMSTQEEIQITVDYLNNFKANFALLHCNSTYPAPLHDINLSWLKELEKIHDLIGYSGHERGINVSIGAAALGAKIIERHYTLDRGMEGPDHAASLETKEFSNLVLAIREIEEAMGSGLERNLSQGEMINRENLSKSIVSHGSIQKGTVIKEENLKILSPGQGLSAQYLKSVIGREAKRDFEDEDYFYMSDIQDLNYSPRSYSFTRPWGVPVRYHDFSEYNERICPDIYEFHLSYKDLELKIDDYLSGTYEAGFVVHAPELFAGSNLMDLASDDSDYRKFSIEETQKVIDITVNLKKFFPKTETPMIVANIGGFSMDSPFPKDQLEFRYNLFRDSLNALNLDGVELIPQTMAPFPWHFGGQRYQNLFVHADQIEYWCNELDLRMCFDISHSMLTCNHFNLDFYDFAETVAPFTSHLHLGDASGVNGEGLQIGDGEIDFVKLSKILNEHCPEASFIPEIWQGHKNFGEGFWIALEKLENTI